MTIAAQLAGWGASWRYQRDAVAHGQWWRFVTANFVHLGWMHLARDLAGLVLVWWCFSPRFRERTWLALTLVCSLGVTLGIHLFSPGLAWYVGLSGVLFGWFAAGAASEWHGHRRYSIALLAGMSALLAYTLIVGPLPGEEAGLGGSVVAESHLYGALAGLAFILCRGGLPRQRLA